MYHSLDNECCRLEPSYASSASQFSSPQLDRSTVTSRSSFRRLVYAVYSASCRFHFTTQAYFVRLRTLRTMWKVFSGLHSLSIQVPVRGEAINYMLYYLPVPVSYSYRYEVVPSRSLLLAFIGATLRLLRCGTGAASRIAWSPDLLENISFFRFTPPRTVHFFSG